MVDTLPVLEAVKAILTAVDGPAELVEVYIRPSADPDDPMPTFEQFPVAVVQEAVFLQTTRIRRITQLYYERSWLLEFFILLGEKRLPDSEVERRARGWKEPIEAALLANPYLNNTVERWGQGVGGDDLTIRTGHCHVYHEESREPDAYWGIEVQIPVVTRHEYEELEYIEPEPEPNGDENGDEIEP